MDQIEGGGGRWIGTSGAVVGSIYSVRTIYALRRGIRGRTANQFWHNYAGCCASAHEAGGLWLLLPLLHILFVQEEEEKEAEAG